MSRDASVLARYEEIAIDLARKIASRELKEGDRLLGRSTLAGTYRVSPETIRRAVAILHAHGIVDVVQGSGIRVVSRRAAVEFLERLQTRTAIENLRQELLDLLARRRELDDRLADVGARLAQLAVHTLEASRRFEEIPIPPRSWLAGQTLASARLRNRTGVTVIGVVRGGEEFYAPEPDFRLEAGDLLMVIGSESARARLQELVDRQEPPAD